MSEPIVRVSGLEKAYGGLKVLRGIHWEVPEGAMAAVMGRSGSGKSTLLAVLGSLEPADAGNVVVAGEDVRSLRGRALDRFRNQRVGFIFQDHLLLPEFTALENVLMPVWVGTAAVADAESFAMELLEKLGVADRRDHYPGQLSGGEQQRVAVARALINRPRVILADEPTGNLDRANAHALHELFDRFRREYGITFIIATHNEELGRRCDSAWELRDGVLHPLKFDV